MTEPTEQELARFIDANVHLCLSSLVSTLAQGAGLPHEGNLGPLADLAEQAFELCSPVDDYEEAARQEGWALSDAGTVYHHTHDDTFDTWQEACEVYYIAPCEWEIFEHWAVSNWFAEQLEARGERVDRDFAGLCIWGRTTTGQPIAMDAVVKAIWRELHKEEV